MTQVFFMPDKSSTVSDPVIISPSTQVMLDELDAKHQFENEQLAQLEALADLMDTRFKVPLLPVPIGLDTIIGLIPGIGDTISLGIASFIVAGSHRLDIPKRHLTRMGGNMLIDWLIGLVPVIGDLFDIGWQGNVRNVKIARSHLEKRWEKERGQILD
jgi:hypothetical protein